MTLRERRGPLEGGRVVEDHPSIDVNVLSRGGFLEPGTHTWLGAGGEWARPGLTIISAGGLIEIRLGEQPLAEVEIARTPCHYGGARPWFYCPEPACGVRVGKLFWTGTRWCCRRCAGLRYASQLQNRATRRLCRARSIRARLGGVPSLAAPFPPKPRSMRWSTYARLREEALEAERVWASGLPSELTRIRRRVGSPAVSKGG